MDQFLKERKRTTAARERGAIVKPLMIIQSQLLATKFYAPTSPGTLLVAFAKESKRSKRLPEQSRSRRLP
jgi:hypothetical protein